MKKITISAVSYLNTKPFIYGLTHSDINEAIDLQLDIPSTCAKKLIKNEVDIALVPVAILKELTDYHIISDFGIGCDGAVSSVMLYSDVPLNEISEIYLDYQSRTSVQLVKILCDKLWKITPKWIPSETGYESKIKKTRAGLVIGDRTFSLHSKFRYSFDLGFEWKNLTGLPFLFACWISTHKIPEEFILKFNLALKHGINNVSKISSELKYNELNKLDIENYLKNNISFFITTNHKNALNLFLSYIS